MLHALRHKKKFYKAQRTSLCQLRNSNDKVFPKTELRFCIRSLLHPFKRTLSKNNINYAGANMFSTMDLLHSSCFFSINQKIIAAPAIVYCSSFVKDKSAGIVAPDLSAPFF